MFLLALPTEARTYDLDGVIQSKTRTYYDTKRMQYNTDGLVVATKDANNNVVELDYDAVTGQFPVAERLFVESGELAFTAEYDYGLGAIVSATDLNNNTSEFYYDRLGRLTDIVDPMGTRDHPQQRTIYYSTDCTLGINSLFVSEKSS